MPARNWRSWSLLGQQDEVGALIACPSLWKVVPHARAGDLCLTRGGLGPHQFGVESGPPHSTNEHQKSGLIADDGDVPLAGRGVLQSKHAPWRQSPRLTVGRGDGKATLQDDAELRCGSGMVEAVQVRRPSDVLLARVAAKTAFVGLFRTPDNGLHLNSSMPR